MNSYTHTNTYLHILVCFLFDAKNIFLKNLINFLFLSFQFAGKFALRRERKRKSNRTIVAVKVINLYVKRYPNGTRLVVGRWGGRVQQLPVFICLWYF